MTAAEALKSLTYEQKLDLIAIIYAAIRTAVVSTRVQDSLFEMIGAPQRPALEVVNEVVEALVVDVLDGSKP